MKWMVVGFFFSLSYKSVLRAMMIKVEYEKTMDTIDDMLQSEIPIMMENVFSPLLETDPRKKVKALSDKIEWYDYVAGTAHDWINKG